MQVATALRIVSVVVAAKALLIGVVYWRRAEILGRPLSDVARKAQPRNSFPPFDG
jgi:hypothetical protein